MLCVLFGMSGNYILKCRHQIIHNGCTPTGGRIPVLATIVAGKTAKAVRTDLNIMEASQIVATMTDAIDRGIQQTQACSGMLISDSSDSCPLRGPSARSTEDKD